MTRFALPWAVSVATLLSSCTGGDPRLSDGAPAERDAAAIAVPLVLDASSSALLPDLGDPLGGELGGASPDAGPSPKPTLAQLWSHEAHFAIDQNPAPVPGYPGHREAFAVARGDLGAGTVYLYHRCYTYPGGMLSIDLCLSVSIDGGDTYPVERGIVVHNALGHFAVAPSVAMVNGTWTMVWEEGGSSGGTHWATSPDGLSWDLKGALFPGVTYNATPSLYVFQGVVYVFTAQKISSESLAIVLFSGADMTQLVQYGGGPVLSPAQNPGWGGGSVSMPRVVYQGGYHYMIFEGATLNYGCGGSTAWPNVFGWGLARSTSLTQWDPYDGNPIAQSVDDESCGSDMPQPLLRPDGAFYVYHTSDDVKTLLRTRLALGSACAANQLSPNWREKNYVCMPSCGGIGGTSCSQTKNCVAGAKVTVNASFPGMSNDCVSCCN